MRQAHEVAREFTADHPIVQGKVHGIMSYDEFRKRYPEAWDLYKQNERDYRTTLTAYAFTHPLPNGHSVIAVNPALMNPRTLYRTYLRDQRTTPPFHPAGTTARDIIYHEMGHAAHHAWDSMAAHSNSPAAYMSLANVAYRLLDNNHARNAAEFANRYTNASSSISGYANTNSHELVAEALTDMRANGKNAKPMSRAINYALNNREKALQRVVQLYNRASKKHARKRAQQ